MVICVFVMLSFFVISRYKAYSSSKGFRSHFQVWGVRGRQLCPRKFFFEILHANLYILVLLHTPNPQAKIEGREYILFLVFLLGGGGRSSTCLPFRVSDRRICVTDLILNDMVLSVVPWVMRLIMTIFFRKSWSLSAAEATALQKHEDHFVQI